MSETIETTTLRQAREATVREHVDAENRHDPDATVATFSASRARYDIPAMGPAGDIGWAGIPNSGKSFATRLAAIFDFEADQLVCERLYMDFSDIARQLTEA